MRGFFVLLLVAVVALCNGQVSNFDYCSIKCRDNDHTMCTYSESAPAAECSEVKLVTEKLTTAEKLELVQAHNRLRRKVARGLETRGNPGPQPAARNMKRMLWDNELAKIAERWARQCRYGHDKCRDTSSGAVGQNVARKSFTGVTNFSMTSFVEDWYNEVELFDASEVSKFRYEPSTAHYTQIVWANTNRVGCGAVRYIRSPNWNSTYLVCNYGPSGNYIDEPMYQIRT